jgi:hypothetical protein
MEFLLDEQLLVAHLRLVRMCYTVAITPEELQRIYWTMVPMNTITFVKARNGALINPFSNAGE